jgi:hypothetical protein
VVDAVSAVIDAVDVVDTVPEIVGSVGMRSTTYCAATAPVAIVQDRVAVEVVMALAARPVTALQVLDNVVNGTVLQAEKLPAPQLSRT